MEAIFHDRRDAGRQLGRRLLHLKSDHPVVMGLPRGGVPVAVEVVRVLQGWLDLMIVHRITAPDNADLTVGAVLDNAQVEVYVDDQAAAACGMSREAIDREVVRLRHAIALQQSLYAVGRPRPDIQNETVILVDDALVTGATARVAIRALYHEHARRVVIAVPVATATAVAALKDQCDELIVLAMVEDLSGVRRAYADFSPVTDFEIIRLIREIPAPHV